VVAPEAAHLIAVCEAHRWDTRSAAASLGIARSTLYYRLKAAGVSPRASRKEPLEFHWNSMEFQGRLEHPSR
jgi:DNA-binding NtrC family response regulator